MLPSDFTTVPRLQLFFQETRDPIDQDLQFSAYALVFRLDSQGEGWRAAAITGWVLRVVRCK